MPLLGIYPMECKSACNRHTYTPVYSSTSHKSQGMESAQVPNKGQMDKANGVIYNELLLCYKEQCNYVICRKVSGTGQRHVKQSEPDLKDK
jgi:hypothetical protein